MAAPEIIRVALVDDHKVVTQGLRAFLESFPDIRVVGITTSGEELLDRIADWPEPQVILMDLLMPGGIDGIETTRRLTKLFPKIKTIALTASTDEARMTAVLRAGAAGYVRKDAEPELLLQAVRSVAAGKPFIDPAVAGQAMTSAVPAELSQREIEVLREVASGKTNREIGDRLFISEETVKSHVAHILTKLSLQNRTQLAAFALKYGLVDPEQ